MVILLILLYSAVSGKEADKFTKLYAYNKDLPAGSIVFKTDISEIKVSNDSSLNQNYAPLNTIEGKYIHSDVKSGQLIIGSDLFEHEPLTVFKDLERGNVLYTLSMKAPDVNGWWIRPGNIVDILILDTKVHGQSNDLILGQDNPDERVIILENLRVIRLMDENGNNIKDSGKLPVIICLEISYEKAGILFDAESTKKIKIITGNKN